MDSPRKAPPRRKPQDDPKPARGGAVKFSISMPGSLLRAADKKARRQGRSRSNYFQQLVAAAE